MLYLDRASLMGKSLHEVFPPEEADFFYGAIQTTFKTRETNSFTYSLDLPKGPIWFRGTLTFFENAGGDHHVVMFIRDITKEIEAEAKERQHQQKLLQTIIETQESERSRIASDMHDGIGQMFAVLKLNIARLKREEEKELFDDALDSIDTIAAELRLIARNLMPVSLQRFGLNATLGSESKILEQRFGIKIDCTTQTKRDRYSEAIEICIYRIAQELLVNIVKHSHAKNAKVCLLETEENKLVLEISDDGRGFATHKRSMAGEGRGLMNIQSRVHAFGGSLRIDSSEDQGSNIRIEIPISEQEPL
ncbi:MAG: ATP-binding protein [Candidatus Kapaibacterium sp.]